MKQVQWATLLLLAITASSALAKYAHNVGVTDWSSKNIGAISHAIIDRQSIYFLGKSGLFGHMSRENGGIQISHGIDPARQI